MKKILLLVSILCYTITTEAQTVTTLAGSSYGFADSATVETIPKFDTPSGVAIDASGNVYVADTNNHKIRKITPSGMISTFAGSTQGSADGVGTAAQFFSPQGIDIDGSGNVYVADTNNNRIRKITPSGVVTTITGSGFQSGYADGIYYLSQFNSPVDVAVDSNGNVYVADRGNHKIRKITPLGYVLTLAGSTSGYADGIKTAAKFYLPSGVAVDANGNIYVADSNNNKIRKITPSGEVSTLAGSISGYIDGVGTAAAFKSPNKITVDKNNNLYVTDNYFKIRKVTPNGEVTTYAGSTSGYADGISTVAQFRAPIDIALDANNNLYIADSYNHKVRKINPSGEVTTLAGSTQGFDDSITIISPKFAAPDAVALDASGNVYVSDYGNHKIRKITPNGIVTTFAGSTEGFAEGTGTAAQFAFPEGITTDVAGNVYLADHNNGRIRKITPSGVVSTFAGQGGVGYLDGPLSNAMFKGISDIAFDSKGNMYVVDMFNHMIRKITPDGMVSTLAGSTQGYADGTGTAARFNQPAKIAVDSNGNVYVADSENSAVRKITPSGVVTTLEGSPIGLYANINGIKAQFIDTEGVAVDANGNVFVSDYGNNRIMKITPNGTVIYIAGGTAGFADTGVGVSAKFNGPSGLAIDANGTLYVADTKNHKIRKITSRNLDVTKNNISNKTIKIYPNPTHGVLNIELKDFSTTAKLTITDILGKTLYSQKIETNKTTISTSSYSKGIYFATVVDGNKIGTQKFIVE